MDLELSSKESEVENMRNRLNKEKEEFESEQRERYLRDIEVKQIKIEERREQLSLKE